MRSSQPLVGPSNKRCKEDERLLNAVLGPGKRGYIIDTRSQSIAQTAKNRGFGYEVEIHYPQWRRIQKPVERHQTLLDSLSKLVDGTSIFYNFVLILTNSFLKDEFNCSLQR